ncbi:hypothetical protein, partial [Niastella koreensis]
LFDWGCKGSVSHLLLQNFSFSFHNFFFFDFVTIFQELFRSNRAAKISAFHSHFQTFFHLFLLLFSSVSVLILSAVGKRFLCKELLCYVLFCKAGRKDRRV